MMKIGPFGWLLGIGAGAIAIGAMYKGVVRMKVQEVRDEIFEIGPDCEISLREGVSFEGEGNGLEKAKTHYFEPLIEGFQAEGMDKTEIKDAVMEDLFPECEWPPPNMLSSQYVLYIGMAIWLEGVIEEIKEGK